MRTVLAPTLQALGRRGIALERGAMLTLRRDAYATTPGPTIGLAIGERTTYRPGAWILDTFERAALGSSYPSWGGSAGLTLTNHQVVPTGVGPVGMVTHLWAVPRDPWAAVQLAALSGPSAVGGVLLRATDTDAYRVTARSAGTTVVESIVAGTATTLATVATPWRAGDVLRVELVWTRLRVYREPILVAEVTVAVPGDGRLVGMVAGRIVSGDAVALTQFVAGEARQEYVGAGLDLGDVQRVLGQPASFEVTLSNLAPLGGWPRFASMLRHGLNTDGTYDLDKGDVRVLTVIDGHAPPLTAGVGLIDGPAEVTEDRVRLAVRGRDAFLTPQLAPGPVTYLPGPAPGGLTPLPADPCAPSVPPVVDAGPTPAEPASPPVIDLGPDAPPAPPITSALLGGWMVEMVYTMSYGGGPGGSNVYTGSTTVTALTNRTAPLQTRSTIGAGSRTFPDNFYDILYYRGPDMTGLTLGPVPVSGNPSVPAGAFVDVFGQPTGGGAGDFGMTLRLAHLDGSGIQTQADLAALRPRNPAESSDPMPTRIKTLHEWAINYTHPAVTCTADPHGDAAFLATDHPVTKWAGGTAPIGLERTTGPQLLRMEIANTAPTQQLYAEVATAYMQVSGPGFFGGSGPCGVGMHHFVTESPVEAAFAAPWLQP